MTGAIFRHVCESDREPIFSMMKRAFYNDPLLRWIYHEDQRYDRYFEDFFYAYGGDPFKYGSGLTYRDGQGGAVFWHPCPQTCDYDNLWNVFMETASEDRREDVIAVFKEFVRLHPANPYRYITFVGRDPLLKRSVMPVLKEVFRGCDEQAGIACGEATSPVHAKYYAKFGSTVLGEVQRGCSIKYYTMMRSPRAAPVQLQF